MKFINDTRSKIFGNSIFEMKVCYLIWSYFKRCLQFKKIKDVLLTVSLMVFYRYGRTRTRGFFSTVRVRVVSFTTCMLSINLLKHLFMKLSVKPFLKKN